jgi:hypothetical protein
MCLLIVAEKTFPEERILELGAKRNKDGMGIAWRENGKVKVRKGVNLTVADLVKIGKETEAPWVIHFRLSTAGGVNTELCHPFSVDKRACTEAEFEAQGILAHNGVWVGWQKELDDLPMSLPEPNMWSDTRAMAFIGGLSRDEHLRKKFFNGCDEKLAYMTADSLCIFGKGWTDKGEGLFLSNDICSWEENRSKTSNYVRYNYGYCEGGWDETEFEEYGGDSTSFMSQWTQRGVGRESFRNCLCAGKGTCSVCKSKNGVEAVRERVESIKVTDFTQDEWVMHVLKSLDRQGIRDIHQVHAARIMAEEVESQEATMQEWMKEHGDFYGLNEDCD